ncbi:MAG: chemotaxis protein CheW [Pseudomonadota bacterium]
MLFLLFQLGRDRYALDATQVAAVLPLLDIKTIPQAPTGVVGAINYHGAPVPAIDLSELTLGRSASRRLSTRIMLVQYADAEGVQHLLGLIAEKATETLRREASEFRSSGVTNAEVPYLGPVLADARGLIQWIAVEKLLSTSVRDVLFKPENREWQNGNQMK